MSTIHAENYKSTTLPSVSPSQTTQFIKDYFGGSPGILCSFLPAEKNDPRGTNTASPEWEAQVEEWKAEGRNIYYQVSLAPGSKKSSKDEVNTLLACHIDIDTDKKKLEGLEPEEQKALHKAAKELNLRHAQTLIEQPFAPSYVIDTGNGVQCLWRLTAPLELTDSNRHLLISRVEAVNIALGNWYTQNLGDTLKTDTPTKNADRLLRLPGTLNYPKGTKVSAGFEIVPSYLLESCPTRTYSLEQLEEFLNVSALPERAANEIREAYQGEGGLASREKVEGYLKNLSPDCGRDDWFRIACAIHHEFEGDEIGFEIFHKWSAKSKAKYLGEEDCRTMWDSLGNKKGPLITFGTLVHKANEIEGYEESPAVITNPQAGWSRQRQAIDCVKSIDWLVKDYFESNAVSLIWGDTKAYKSFLAIELGFCIANGLDWYGHKVKQGAVLYVCGEGHAGIGRRLAGLEKKYQIKKDAPFYVSHASKDMLEPKVINEIIAMGRSLNEPVNFVCFDTVNRNFSGDENNAKDVSKVFTNLERVKNDLDCSVSLVHHTGKNGATFRGSAAWAQNIDAAYEVKRGAKLFTTLKPVKMKDAEEAPIMGFKLKVQSLGFYPDADGEIEEATTLIAEECETKNIPKVMQLRPQLRRGNWT